MADPIKCRAFLTSKKEIMAYLGIGDEVFQKFVNLKIPVVMIDGKYYAHCDNLDKWCISLTEKQRQAMTENPQ